MNASTRKCPESSSQISNRRLIKSVRLRATVKRANCLARFFWSAAVLPHLTVCILVGVVGGPGGCGPTSGHCAARAAVVGDAQQAAFLCRTYADCWRSWFGRRPLDASSVYGSDVSWQRMTKSCRSLLDQEIARFRPWAAEYDGPRRVRNGLVMWGKAYEELPHSAVAAAVLGVAPSYVTLSRRPSSSSV